MDTDASFPSLSSYFTKQRGRRASLNIIHRLKDREIALKCKYVPFHTTRKLYQNIVPNFTCTNIEKPPCYLRKFSPDGNLLIAYSSDQTSIEIYQYQGPAAAESLLKNWPSDCEYSDDDNPKYKDLRESQLTQIRRDIFGKLFHLKHTINVTSNNEQLHRECGLFTDDSRYFIAGSAMISDDSHYFEIYRTNESIFHLSRISSEDYSIYLIDLKEGRLCDRKVFKTDKINLSHNQGIYLCGNTVAILSLQHQEIHILKIIHHSKGYSRLEQSRVIGRFCYEDDQLLLSAVSNENGNGFLSRGFRETSINSLKHRILTYIFNEAYYSTTDRAKKLRRFYQNFDQFCSLKMFKLQLLSPNHLLIRLTAEVNLPRIVDLCPCLFVVYEIDKAQVIAAYDNSSTELLWLLENFCDQFRCVQPCFPSQIVCSPSNNYYARVSQKRYKQTLINSRGGGPAQAVKQLLAQIPMSAQSYTCTPYLDLSLFSYDDKWMSTTERPRNFDENAIRFYTRESCLLRFKIFAGSNRSPPSPRRVVAFIFHPSDPLAISVERINTEYHTEYVVNIHLRHS